MRVEKATLGRIGLAKRLKRARGPTVASWTTIPAGCNWKVKRTWAGWSVGFWIRNQVSKGGWVEPSAKNQLTAGWNGGGAAKAKGPPSVPA